MAKASPGRELFGFTTKSLQSRPTWTFPAREKQIEYSNKKCIQTAGLLQSHCNWLLQLNAYCNDLLWHTFSSNRCCVLTEICEKCCLNLVICDVSEITYCQLLAQSVCTAYSLLNEQVCMSNTKRISNCQ